LAALVLQLGGVALCGATTLDQCIQAALAGSPDVLAARHRVEAGAATIDQARSAYLPRLAAGINYVLTDNPPQAFMMQLNQRQLNMDPASGFDPNNPHDTDNVRVSATARYRLYDGGRRGEQKAMAELGKATAAEQLAAVRNALIHEVTRGYYGALQARAFVDVQDKAVRSLEENLRVARERFEAGSVVKTDVLNLEVRLAEARERLIRARHGEQLAVAALNTAIGSDLVARVEELAVPSQEAGPPPSEGERDAAENRPELRAAHKAALIKERDYRRVKADRIPSVSAFGSYDWDSEELNDFEGSYTVGVTADWEFFRGGQTQSAVRKTRSEWRAARQDEEKVRIVLRLDIHRAHLGTLEAWERMGVARKSVESAEEALRITRERYQQGAAGITELLVAEVGLTETRTRNVAAYYDYLTALSNYDRSMGALAAKHATDTREP
jgi:outer membrane protein TolC